MSEWFSILIAPKDGTRIMGRDKHQFRSGRIGMRSKTTWYGKASHVPIYGWCYGGVENVHLWSPIDWKPISKKPCR